ncbi:hypothetical protein GALL_548330 [mine drainage metagenome]|uniref:Uncharacterized protein n=1 Tax=mine drainage metagenome TaxID=410659 RepID=A0A1J5NWM6_9ZZZZ
MFASSLDQVADQVPRLVSAFNGYDSLKGFEPFAGFLRVLILVCSHSDTPLESGCHLRAKGLQHSYQMWGYVGGATGARSEHAVLGGAL